MAKLGKKARKFAKKNLQSVLRHKRKTNSMFKKKASKRKQQDAVEDHEGDKLDLSSERKPEVQDIGDISLDALLGGDCSDLGEDDSDSDGYLEVSTNAFEADMDDKTYLGEDGDVTALSVQNKDIDSELVEKKKKLDKLKEKDPGFCKFLENNDERVHQLSDEEMFSDDEEASGNDTQTVGESLNSSKLKLITASTINVLCQEATELQNVSALTSLLNCYRAACHYGSESSGFPDGTAVYKIQNKEVYSTILAFMLCEADKMFRNLLGISCSNCKKETILDMKNTSKWKTTKPLMKSYLRSTLFLLNQVTDSKILVFSLTQLRASIICFAGFPSLLHRLIKISIHLWATGDETLSSHAFLVVRDVAFLYGNDWFDICLIRTYKAFIGHCKFLEPGMFNHIKFLRNSIVELCSMDLQKSSSKALVSLQQLAKILQSALQTKNKEAVKKICSWQFANCIDLWVEFVSSNIHDYDLQPLLYTIIQIVNGVAHLFLGPRYLPLRIKCIQWLNHLSCCCGIFIPVGSFATDILEYKVGKVGGKPGKDFNFSTSVRLPKHWLKSQNFQEQCVSSAIELLCTHFDHWSYHISFPELATVPLIRLRKFYETTTNEVFRRLVKRLIDQVELNVDFVRKKRDEVAFSPKDQQSVESFLQCEKSSGNASFKQYYESIIQKSVSQNLFTSEKFR
ncbi:nucleolar complex-associated protein 2 isoform X2 [Rhodamnia argentea]|uniref:Nucleolar complex protein 2 homolog isoform X2 n=1 Tax=Rhodamnia argentea TaxID=178133 RepID=A0A8B8Q8L9_9MYRT|nr:nucleolar complex-associated protein 2 isoform X2 [Rhodamnia argentea]XP_048134881.1 nucleolar complex-associated protein 2 isoform X2 [Rhodamnia argentea]